MLGPDFFFYFSSFQTPLFFNFFLGRLFCGFFRLIGLGEGVEGRIERLGDLG